MTLSPLPAPRWGAVLAEFPSTLSTTTSPVVSGVSTAVSSGVSSQLLMACGKTTAGQFANTTSFNGVLNDYWAMTYAPSSFTVAGPSGGASGFAPTGASGTFALHWQYLGGGVNPLGTGITPRYDAMGSFDGKTITVVGGTDGKVMLSDTWSWSPSVGVATSVPSGTWVQQPIANSITAIYSGGTAGPGVASAIYNAPTTLKAASMSYNPVAPTGAILYGGGVAYKRVGYSNDQWGYAQGMPGTYTLMSNPNGMSPSARQYASQATDTSGNTVLFGGQNANGGLSDTWVYTLAAGWTQITATTGAVAFVPGTTSPAARYGAAFAYDQTHGVFVLFGGLTANGYDNTTWTYTVSTKTWAQQTAGTAPSSMAFASMAYLTTAAGVVLFGGLGYQQCYNDTYLFSGTSWTKQ